MTDRDEETKPCLRIITDIDGMTVAVTSNFHDTDEGWDGRDAAFEKYDTPQAVDFLDQINKLIADGLKVGLEISEKVPAE